MKNLFFFCLLATCCSVAHSQRTEFHQNDNGLIYSENTMNQLNHIVDSLNLRYKSCDFDQRFFSKYQGLAHYFELEERSVKSAVEDLSNNISFDDFVTKYPNAKIEKNLLVVKFKYSNSEGEEEIAFSSIALGKTHSRNIYFVNEPDRYFNPVAQTWLYKLDENSDDSIQYVNGFYFPAELTSKPLPESYCQMIQYADCMIDTTATKIKEQATYGSLIDFPEDYSNLSLAEKQQLLENMRNTKVIGYCSQDQSPRIHAYNIAVLSAETVNWEVFLKAHLDIMNDRFERLSDGSYAWNRRKTYIEELEALHIDVPSLIFGISFRIENSSKNHYYGSIGRLGRSIAESKEVDVFKNRMLEIIQNPALDDYNRILAYYLFDNFNYYLSDELAKSSNLEALKAAIETLPDYLKNKLSF